MKGKTKLKGNPLCILYVSNTHGSNSESRQEEEVAFEEQKRSDDVEEECRMGMGERKKKKKKNEEEEGKVVTTISSAGGRGRTNEARSSRHKSKDTLRNERRGSNHIDQRAEATPHSVPGCDAVVGYICSHTVWREYTLGYLTCGVEIDSARSLAMQIPTDVDSIVHALRKVIIYTYVYDNNVSDHPSV
tara:strand:- start:440 stop:1006 length:567 start_codon:yes stop_codon:yes gene_type:complete